MSRLDELIQELCPDGVEQLKISEVTNYEQPSKYIVDSTDYSDDFNTPVLTAGQTFILGYTNETEGIYEASKDKPVIIFDDFTGALKWVDFPFKVKSSALKLITANNKILIRYLYHTMENIGFTSDEHKRLWISIYSEIKVAVPPLEVQREVVRILDSFTLLTSKLTSKLTAELTARKSQYEFYRRELLTFDESIPQLQLRDVASFRNGKGHEKNIEDSGKYVVINSKFISTNGQVIKNSDEQLSPLYIDDIAMVMSDLPNGRALAKCYLINRNDKFTLNQRIGGFHTLDEHKVVTKYLFYILDRNWQLLKYDNGVDQTNLKKDDILNISIPVPSIDVQKRLVHVLDNFDMICSDLNIGLPAEIEARQKQYEFYRDALLTYAATGKIIAKTDRQTDRQTDS